MKHLLFLSIFVVCTNNINAQLTVYSDGKVGISTTSTSAPESTLSVKGGSAGFDASVKGTNRGIFGASYGQYLGWAYGVYGKNYATNVGFQCGVSGIAELKTAQSDYRTYGVMGIAGNATNGWNYGIYGQLNGTNNGAGVYGTATNGENGSYVDGRYAGYFNGATKIKGTLTVTGTINGVIVNQISNSAEISSLSEDDDFLSVSDRLSKISATCYYTDEEERAASVMLNSSDTTNAITTASEAEPVAESRMHYGLDTSQLKEFFPELIYEQPDGKVGVNLIEMIPILVQEVNRLRSEITQLKNNQSVTSEGNSGTKKSAVTLTTDGKIVVTKRKSSN